MLLLVSTSDKVQVVSASGANLAVHASWADYLTGGVTPGRTNSLISTAATTDVVGAPAASTYRNVKLLTIRNAAVGAAVITVQHTDGTTVVPIWSGSLAAGATLWIDDKGTLTVISSAGLPYTPVGAGQIDSVSTANQTGFASDAYIAGSALAITPNNPRIGTTVLWQFDMTKTAAGTATPIISVRFGNGASVSDTAILTLTFAAGTAAADKGWFIVSLSFRSVGSGTSAVVQGVASLISNLTNTGLSTSVKVVPGTSAGFDSTAGSFIGLSFNGGSLFSGTMTQAGGQYNI